MLGWVASSSRRAAGVILTTAGPSSKRCDTISKSPDPMSSDSPDPVSVAAVPTNARGSAPPDLKTDACMAGPEMPRTGRTT